MAVPLKPFNLTDTIAMINGLDLSEIRPGYKVLELETIDEPPISDVVHVAMNEFGYIGPSESKQWLDTYGLGPCIGVHIQSPGTGYQLLMHSSGNWLWQAQELVRFARQRKMVRFIGGENPLNSDEQITIYASGYSSARDVCEVQKGLYGMGCRAIEVVTSKKEDSIDIIFNSKGEKFWLGSVHPRFDTKLSLVRMEARAFNTSTLHCVNTEEDLHKQDTDRLFERRCTHLEDGLSRKYEIKKILNI